MKDGGPQLRFEALRTFRNLPFPQGPKIERELALDEHADKNLRLEAIAGLAMALDRDEHDAATIAALRRLLTGADSDLACQALRALRRSARNPDVRERPQGLVGRLEAHPAQGETARRWPTRSRRRCGPPIMIVPKELASADDASCRIRSTSGFSLAASGGDPEAGRRLVRFSQFGRLLPLPHGARAGRQNRSRSSRPSPGRRIATKLAESILRPAKEIAPQFATWSFVTRGGRHVERRARLGGSRGTCPHRRCRRTCDRNRRVPDRRAQATNDFDHARAADRPADGGRIPRPDRLSRDLEVVAVKRFWPLLMPCLDGCVETSVQPSLPRPCAVGMSATSGAVRRASRRNLASKFPSGHYRCSERASCGVPSRGPQGRNLRRF